MRRSKYNAKPSRYNGVLYHSKREAQYAATLDLLKKARGKDRVVGWTRQVRVPLYVNGAKICTWVPDFRVTTADGVVAFHEVKGVETPEFKLKLKLFKALYPDAVLRIIR